MDGSTLLAVTGETLLLPVDVSRVLMATETSSIILFTPKVSLFGYPTSFFLAMFPVAHNVETALAWM